MIDLCDKCGLPVDRPHCEERKLLCIHLGDPTGATVPTRCNCGEHGLYRDVPVFRCRIHGVTIQRPQRGTHEPQWDGVDCLTCELRETSSEEASRRQRARRRIHPDRSQSI